MTSCMQELQHSHSFTRIVRMDILLIGSGGREHALAQSIAQSPQCGQLYCTPGNPGIARYATCIEIPGLEHHAVIAFCQTHNIAGVIIGPEAPLANGLADDLRHAGIAVFGPSQLAAQLESSKHFAKTMMHKYGIPTARYATFHAEQEREALQYVVEQSLPIVIKADGLAAGKGVTIAETYQQAESAVRDALQGKFGSAGTTIVIEEFLRGEEASVFAVCDGERFVVLAPAQDHKRIYDDDKGENTGGMGAYAPAPIVNDDVLHRVKTRIIEPLLRGMKHEGMPFVGCLFCGLMIEDNEPSVVEFNARFGDPETQVVLSVFRGDLLQLLISSAQGQLDETAVYDIANGYACVVVMAAQGYPGDYTRGDVIDGISFNEEPEGKKDERWEIFYAGVKKEHGLPVTAGGRVLGVCGMGATLSEAINNSYEGVRTIKFAGAQYRTDIGAKGVRGV